MNLLHHCVPIHRARLLSKSLIVAIISTMSWVAGLAPDFSGRSPVLVFNSTVLAQAVSPQDVSNYARTILALEPVRKDALARIEKILGKVPPIACSDSKTIDALSGEARAIAVNFCNESKKIVESNGLTANTFNQITANVQNDPALQQRIQQEMLRIQQTSGK